MARGHQVTLPLIDLGVDLYCNGHALQVKSSREQKLTERARDKEQRGFAFGFQRLAPEVDFLVLVGISATFAFRHWIIPVAEIGQRDRAAIPLVYSGRYRGERGDFLRMVNAHHEAWHLLG